MTFIYRGIRYQSSCRKNINQESKVKSTFETRIKYSRIGFFIYRGITKNFQP